MHLIRLVWFHLQTLLIQLHHHPPTTLLQVQTNKQTDQERKFINFANFYFYYSNIITKLYHDVTMTPQSIRLANVIWRANNNNLVDFAYFFFSSRCSLVEIRAIDRCFSRMAKSKHQLADWRMYYATMFQHKQTNKKRREINQKHNLNQQYRVTHRTHMIRKHIMKWNGMYRTTFFATLHTSKSLSIQWIP